MEKHMFYWKEIIYREIFSLKSIANFYESQNG